MIGCRQEGPLGAGVFLQAPEVGVGRDPGGRRTGGDRGGIPQTPRASPRDINDSEDTL